MKQGPAKVTEEIMKEMLRAKTVKRTPDGVTIKAKDRGSKYRSIDILMMKKMFGFLEKAKTGIAFDAKLYYKRHLRPNQIVVRVASHTKSEGSGPLMYTQQLYDATGVFKAVGDTLVAVKSKGHAKILKGVDGQERKDEKAKPAKRGVKPKKATVTKKATAMKKAKTLA